MDVDGDVVRGLGVEEWEEMADRGRYLVGYYVGAGVGSAGRGGRWCGCRALRRPPDSCLGLCRNALAGAEQWLGDIARVECVGDGCEACAQSGEGRAGVKEGGASGADKEGHGASWWPRNGGISASGVVRDEILAERWMAD